VKLVKFIAAAASAAAFTATDPAGANPVEADCAANNDSTSQ